MSPRRVKEWIRTAALAMGFDRAGFAAATDLGAEAGLEAWLARGYHGGMAWMARDPARRRDPRRAAPFARTVVSLAVNYFHPARHAAEPGAGRISRYAWGGDYHQAIGAMLRRLAARLQEAAPVLAARAHVDTGSVLEKPWAHRAGVGWVGKNANVIVKGAGSWFFLAELMVDIAAEPDPPATDHCGSCTRCIDACPTAAIVAPAVVDSRRCISYLTIEERGPIAPELRSGVGAWIFGCDICQDVCPWNKFSRQGADPVYAPRDGHVAPPLAALAALTRAEFVARFRDTNLTRPGYAGFLRNVMVALGNSAGTPVTAGAAATAGAQAIAALGAGLVHPEPLVRAHAAWGLGRHGGAAARAALAAAARREAEPAVRAEIAAARGEATA
jgi:epoxyqueuosine reductase